jgi:hypothetical protein
MAKADATATIDITAIDKASAVFKNVEAAANSLDKGYQQLKRSGEALIAGLAIERITAATVEWERASNRVNATLRATGGAAGVSRREIDELADSIESATQFSRPAGEERRGEPAQVRQHPRRCSARRSSSPPTSPRSPAGPDVGDAGGRARARLAHGRAPRPSSASWASSTSRRRSTSRASRPRAGSRRRRPCCSTRCAARSAVSPSEMNTGLTRGLERLRQGAGRTCSRRSARAVTANDVLGGLAARRTTSS